MKLADDSSILRYLTDLKSKLDLKAPATHRHARVNGLKVVVADTAPTVNDESVITLIVDTEDVPDVGGLTVQFNGYMTKHFLMNALLGLPEYHYTAQAYLDGIAVPALYQLEYASNGNVVIPFSLNNIFDTFVAEGFQLRVRYLDFEETFAISIQDSDIDEKAARIATYDGSGFFQNGAEVTGAMTYEQASEGFRLVYKFNDDFDSSDFSSMKVERVVGSLSLSSSVANTSDLLEGLQLDLQGYATIGSTEAYYDVTETFTEDDIALGAVYLMTATAPDGVAYYLYLSNKIRDLPLNEHFAGHFTRYALNESFGSGVKDTDNQTEHTSSSMGKYVYFYFELDHDFAYDIEIRLTDTSGTYLKNSTIVPFNPSYGTMSDPIVITAGTTAKYVTGYHKLTTAGTYYILAEVSGVGTNYNQQLLIELTVS